jgi:hypothetical protein
VLAARPLDATAVGRLADGVLGLEAMDDVRALFLTALRDERGGA